MLSTVKLYLNITDTLQDALIQQIIDDVSMKVNSYSSAESVPTELEWIVRELAIIRFNQIGSEGVTTDSQEGKSVTFVSDPFKQYEPYLDKYLADNSQPTTRGKARFL